MLYTESLFSVVVVETQSYNPSSCTEMWIKFEIALTSLKSSEKRTKSSMLVVSPKATWIPSMKLQGQSIANCMSGPRNRTCSTGPHTRQVLSSGRRFDMTDRR